MAGTAAISPVDLAVIEAAKEPYEVLEPLWFLVDFYEDMATYEASLARFSRPQRLVWAICLYRGEVNNGGHDQFYSNSSGLVWRDALLGLEAVDLPMFADILRASVARFKSEPSPDRMERNDELIEGELDFDDLDRTFYATEEEIDLDARLTDYVRAHADDFLFEGQVATPGLPKPTEPIATLEPLAPVSWFKRILAVFRPIR
jgi:hypothetical protein